MCIQILVGFPCNFHHFKWPKRKFPDFQPRSLTIPPQEVRRIMFHLSRISQVLFFFETKITTLKYDGFFLKTGFRLRLGVAQHSWRTINKNWNKHFDCWFYPALVFAGIYFLTFLPLGPPGHPKCRLHTIDGGVPGLDGDRALWLVPTSWDVPGIHRSMGPWKSTSGVSNHPW